MNPINPSNHNINPAGRPPGGVPPMPPPPPTPPKAPAPGQPGMRKDAVNLGAGGASAQVSLPPSVASSVPKAPTGPLLAGDTPVSGAARRAMRAVAEALADATEGSEPSPSAVA